MDADEIIAKILFGLIKVAEWNLRSILWLMSLWNFSRFIPMKVALLMIIGTKLSANG